MITRFVPAAPASRERSHTQRNQLQHSRMSAELLVDRDSWLVGVCACQPGAGASTVAQNMAVMLHERSGEPVVLVEANLRSPVLAHRSGVTAASGFTEFALGDDCMSTIVTDGIQDGVSLMPASSETVPLPLLRNAAPRLSGLREKFRHVLVDLPPVLHFPDAVLLGRALDGVVLVIEAEATRWDAAQQARRRLEAGGVKLLGAVLNKKARTLPDWLQRML